MQSCNNSICLDLEELIQIEKCVTLSVMSDKICVVSRWCALFRTHFNYEQTSKSELSFRKGDIFHVVDTLNMGVVGAWQVFRIGEITSRASLSATFCCGQGELHM